MKNFPIDLIFYSPFTFEFDSELTHIKKTNLVFTATLLDAQRERICVSVRMASFLVVPLDW